MIDPSQHAWPDGSDGEDFRPEDYRSAAAGGVPISADFVQRTLATVLVDQRRIRDEAARVEEIKLPRALIDAYPVPDPSRDFVARTLAGVRESAPTGRLGSDRALQRQLAAYRVPAASPDFVERTLDALRGIRAATQTDGASRPRAVRWTRWAAAAAIVAAVLLAFAFGPARGDSGVAPDALPSIAAAPDFTPAALSTALERWDGEGLGGLRFESPDPLLLLASAGGGRSE